MLCLTLVNYTTKAQKLDHSFVMFTEERTVLFKMSTFGPIATFQVKLVCYSVLLKHYY